MLKKIQSAFSLVEIAESNLKSAKALLSQVLTENNFRAGTTSATTSLKKNIAESEALEVVEGYFDGERMIGDNGQIYLVPQNYASKTQLVVGDRMKWILTPEREIFKLIQPVDRERVTGTFSIEGDSYMVLVDRFSVPVKILKASATFAMKTQSLKPGDEVAILVPKNTTPSWGALVSVIKAQEGGEDNLINLNEGSRPTIQASAPFDLEEDLVALEQDLEQDLADKEKLPEALKISKDPESDYF